MFDYIIIGAGSAGCVLANRLSADPATRVLLLEAGDEDSMPEIQMPAAWPALRGSAVDWNFATQPHSDVDDRSIAWPRGRVLGGSSAINAMIYIRGDRGDYDLWAEMGNPGWAYNEVLPFFRKSENQERGPNSFHGAGGELNVADGRFVTPLAHAFLDACQRSGIERIPDFNGPSPLGASLFQFTQKHGRRWSAAHAFLAPIRSRSNLTIEVKARATQIRFEGTRAVAVDYICDGVRKSAHAGQEIILSAGAIGSPHLLLLSGVGPAQQLKALGITPVVDLPGVGQNLQDHAMLFVSHGCTSPVSMFGAVTPGNIEAFAGTGSGPLTCNGVEAGALLKTDPGSKVPDLQLHFVAYCFSSSGVLAERHGFAIAPTLLHPKSRGELVLKSADPSAAPVIRPRYLTERADIDVLADGVRIARQLAGSGAFDNFESLEVLPGPDVAKRDAVERWIRQTVETCFHPTGTCKMGSDSASVVDAALRVRGLEGLRVVDASIMPEIVSGNTNAPTIMIAERAAAMIAGYPAEASVAAV